MKKIGLLLICCFINLLLILPCLLTPVGAQELSSQTTTSVTPKIVGGHEATPGDWPWMTALVYRGSDAYSGQFCGGALIAPQWVVTAAHCVEDIRPGQIDVVINRHDLTSTDGERVEVTRIIRHRNYNPVTLDSDIAILMLAEPSSQPTLAVIPPRDPDKLALPFTDATILGWGDTTPGYGEYPEVLMEVMVPILPNRISRRIYGDSFTVNMLAAGPKDGKEDACYGDSGGPLIVPNADGTDYVLAGISSWGHGCAQPLSPGLYTRVEHFSYWIDKVVPVSTTIIDTLPQTGSLATAGALAQGGTFVATGTNLAEFTINVTMSIESGAARPIVLGTTESGTPTLGPVLWEGPEVITPYYGEITFFPNVPLTVGERYFIGLDYGFLTSVVGDVILLGSRSDDPIPDGQAWRAFSSGWDPFSSNVDIAARIVMNSSTYLNSRDTLLVRPGKVV